jgi:putative FmdB family regulatory protein
MPTYEYRCPEGHDFELFQKMSDKPRAKCPVCGKQATRQISGGAGLVFKGSGFYITDYGKDGKGPRKDPSGTPSGSSPSASDAASSAPASGSESSTPAPKADKPAEKPVRSSKKKAAE